MTKIVLAMFFLTFVSSSCGYSRLRGEIPNGYNVKHPCPGQPIWSAVGHVSPDYAPRKNAFGESMKANSLQWERVCNLDSDGDGLTNGAELGDPDCKWRPGDPSPGEVLGHPGFCEPNRAKCDSGVIHPQCPYQQSSRAGQQRPQPRPALPGTQDHPQVNWRQWAAGQNLPSSPTRSIFGMPNMPVRGQDAFGRGQQTFPSFSQETDAGSVWGSDQPTVRPAPSFSGQQDLGFSSQSFGSPIGSSQQSFGGFDSGVHMGGTSNFPQSPNFGTLGSGTFGSGTFGSGTFGSGTFGSGTFGSDTFGSSLDQRFTQVGGSSFGSSGHSSFLSPGGSQSTMERYFQDRIPRERLGFGGQIGTDTRMTPTTMLGSSFSQGFTDFGSGSFI